MKRLIATFAAVIAVVALAFTSSYAAHAATRPVPATTHAQEHAGKPIPVNIRMKITRAEVVALNREYGMRGSGVRPDYGPVPVNPTTSCGGFKGDIEWGSGTFDYYLDVWGELWNNACSGATEYLYASYMVGTACYNPQIASAGYAKSGSTGVNWSTDSDFFSFGYITVDVCDNHGGWHCGTAQGPGPVLTPGQC
jgi:hypothetical protein